MGLFHFKQFSVDDSRSAMKTGTDGVLIGCWAEAPQDVRTVIDIGCGAGLIALMMAQRYADATVWGVEISPEAVADARDNIAASRWTDRIEVETGDATVWSPELPRGAKLIVSNPPFFSEALRSPVEQRALARHGSTLNPKTLIETGARLMTEPGDRLSLIAPSERDDEIEFALALNGLSPRRRCEVYSREEKAPFRTMWEAVAGSVRCENTRLAIRDRENRLTDEYMSLTRDFYL